MWTTAPDTIKICSVKKQNQSFQLKLDVACKKTLENKISTEINEEIIENYQNYNN